MGGPRGRAGTADSTPISPTSNGSCHSFIWLPVPTSGPTHPACVIVTPTMSCLWVGQTSLSLDPATQEPGRRDQQSI